MRPFPGVPCDNEGRSTKPGLPHRRRVRSGGGRAAARACKGEMFGREEKVPQNKMTVVQYGILAIFLVLTFGLWRLQVAGSNKYETLAERNRIRTIPILAPRGKIVDREGRLIVDNYPSFSVLLLREQARNLSSHYDLIASGLHMNADDIREQVRRAAGEPSYQPILLKDDITPDELAFVEAHRGELPELETIMVHRRLYPKNGFLAHLIGYVGEVSDQDLNTPQFELYEPGDIVGKSGVEEYYNDLLMGKDGSRRAIVNSVGKEVGRLSETPAVPGKTLKLTIDLDLQMAAEQALNGKNGAIVAMDPRTGEILAMASRPIFDPNEFAVRISREEWTKLVTDPDKPLMNKAIQAQLAPGSVFKVIMSIAGLQEGVAENMHVLCGGGATFYGRYFKCWQKGGHGEVNISKAITQSCDVFFYTLGERLGIDKIARYATELGLGQRTGIDLPDEVSGVMPSEEWKIKNYRQKWYAGETISVAIGQGAVTTTPIQLARALGAITSGGHLVRPHVTFSDDIERQRTELYGANYKPIAAAGPPAAQNLGFDPQNVDTITEAMVGVVNPGGTAALSHVEGVDFAGKTGSAQTVSNQAKERLGLNAKDNGWFVGITPHRDPHLVVAVLFQEGEHGALAARIAAQVVKAYADKQRQRQQQTTEKKQAETVEMAALWSEGDAQGHGRLRGGTFLVPLRAPAAAPLPAAPGMAAPAVPPRPKPSKPAIAAQVRALPEPRWRRGRA